MATKNVQKRNVHMELLISRSNIKSLRFNQSLADQGTRDQCGCEDDVLRHVTVGLGIHVTCKQRSRGSRLVSTMTRETLICTVLWKATFFPMSAIVKLIVKRGQLQGQHARLTEREEDRRHPELVRRERLWIVLHCEMQMRFYSQYFCLSVLIDIIWIKGWFDSLFESLTSIIFPIPASQSSFFLTMEGPYCLTRKNSSFLRLESPYEYREYRSLQDR